MERQKHLTVGISIKTNRMGSEIREKDHEWVRNFHSNFDRLLASL